MGKLHECSEAHEVGAGRADGAGARARALDRVRSGSLRNIVDRPDADRILRQPRTGDAVQTRCTAGPAPYFRRERPRAYHVVRRRLSLGTFAPIIPGGEEGGQVAVLGEHLVELTAIVVVLSIAGVFLIVHATPPVPNALLGIARDPSRQRPV